MHILAICMPTTAEEFDALDQMHHLRAKVFQGRLSWKVRSVAGREYDEFDSLAPTYVVALSSQKRVVGCARLLPAVGTTMLQTVFPQLLEKGSLNSHRGMIESSRFCVDTQCEEGRTKGALHAATLAMFAGIVEWCMLNGYSEIATATDIKFERILNRAGWPLDRLGDPVMINETRSVAGILPADRESFELLRPPSYTSNFIAPPKQVA
jgi:N-acyl-L-homoserine lactone synthetase